MTKLDTIVHHVCERADIHMPSVQDVYDQIVAANAGKYPNVLLLPEYYGHTDWDGELEWLEDNFGGVNGIPIMLEVFSTVGAGETDCYMLSTEQISAAMAVANVKWVRFMEVMGWYYEHSLPFPTVYVTTILNFCKDNNLKVFWSEWTLKNNGFQNVKDCIVGFEGIVTVSFGTNSFDLEPEAGFKWLKNMGFEHRGGSIQAWYWNIRHIEIVCFTPFFDQNGVSDLMNMPISWMITHANECKNLEGEVVQFEPYWYFFGKTDGRARDCLKTLHYYLNSVMAQMETHVTILQTLMGEWVGGPAKDEIQWLEGRAETGWDIQPSTHDFMKMPKKYAVTCYNVGSLNPSQRLWLKVDVVAAEILVKVLGTTLEKAALARENMRVEVERIMHMYSAVGPLYHPYTGPTGALHYRRIPGLKDVVISQTPNQSENASFARIAIQIKCKVFPKKTWVS